MANPYFDSGDYTAPTANTSARASQIANFASAVEAGFDLLPEADPLNEGRITYAGTAGGSADAVTLSMPTTISAYTAGLSVRFKAASDNTAATTVDIDSVGPKSIKTPAGAALTGGEIQADAVVEIAYNGTDFILVSGYVSAAQTTLAAIASDITAVSAIAGNVTTVAGNSANVTTVAGNSGNVTIVAGVSSSVTAVSAIASDVTAVAAIDSDVTGVADIAGDVTTVADALNGTSLLAAIAAISTNGLVARTAAGTAAARTITGTANEIAVTNGDGVSGNPTLAFPSTINLSGHTIQNLTSSTDLNVSNGSGLSFGGSTTEIIGNGSSNSIDLRVNGNTRLATTTTGTGLFNSSPSHELDLSYAASGNTITARFRNEHSASTSSHARALVVTTGTGGGDPWLELRIDSVPQSWSIGVDNTDSDKLKIAPASGVGSGDVVEIDTSGNILLAGNLDLAGNDLVLDDDGDTYLHETADDTIGLVVASALSTTFGAGYVETRSGTSAYTALRQTNGDGDRWRAATGNSNDKALVRLQYDAASAGSWAETWLTLSPDGDYIDVAPGGSHAARFDSATNLLIGGTSTPTSSAGNIVLYNGTAPTASATDGVVIFAEDVTSSSELKVRDEAGNTTTLSPHNFSRVPGGPSEDMAFSYYSERDGRYVNVDMMAVVRTVETLAGRPFVHTGRIA